MITEHEFVRNVRKFLDWIEQQNRNLIITRRNRPEFIVTKIKRKTKTLKDLQGIAEVKVFGDINAHVLPGYDELGN